MKKTLLVNILFACSLITLLGMSSLTIVVAEEEGPEVYQQEVQPMTTLECGRCHYAVFADIRDKGGRHQIPCRKCHKVFHTYRPGKKWKDVLPDCTTCHDQYHGRGFLNCLRCHENAHAPSQSLNVHNMAEDCRTCHAEQETEAERHPSAHTAMSCVECHYGSHGYIASCAECHEEPHAPGFDAAGCIVCHPPHSPLEVSYSEDVASDICAGCHGSVSDKLSASDEGHAFLQCVFCHADKHGYVPTCRDCHETVAHSEEMLKEFKGCEDCHGDVHVLKLQEP